MVSNAIVLDVDGVLADFEKAFCERFGYEKRHCVNLEERYPKDADLIDLFVNFSPVYERLDSIPMGREIAKWCNKKGFDTHIVSSRPDYITAATGMWLKRNSIPFRYLSVANTSKVDRIIRINPLFVVEDILSTCLKCADFGIPSFLVDWPWNQCEDLPKLVKRIRNFDEFQEKVDEIW
jgi:hypothetical protein